MESTEKKRMKIDVKSRRWWASAAFEMIRLAQKWLNHHLTEGYYDYKYE